MSARGIPTTAELAEVLGDFLRAEVIPQTSGRLQFHARVAGNVAGIVERELRLGPAHEDAHRRRLAALGVTDDAELAQAVREGRFDDRLQELFAALRASSVEALRIGNPRHLEPSDAAADG